MRWVKPSSATVSPSCTAALMASESDVTCAIRTVLLLPGVFTAGPRRGQMPVRQWFERQGQATSMLSAQPIFSIEAELAPVLSLGRTPLGERRIIGILGGTVRGPKLQGRILPGGADWQVVRADGAADISARYTIESDGGARILVSSDGLRHGPPEVLAALMRGE